MSRLSAFRSKGCRAVALLDEQAKEGIQDFARNRPILIYPDVTDETVPEPLSPDVSVMLEQAKGRKIVLLAGALAKRKGLLTFLEMARLSSEEGSPYFFAMVGSLDSSTAPADERAEIQRAIAQATDNCFFHLQRVPDGAVYNSWVKSCDLLFAVYEHTFHSSNTLTKAAIFQKPILVAEGYCAAERVRKFEIGRAVPLHEPGLCLENVKEILLDGGQAGAPKFREYSELHSYGRLLGALRDTVEASCRSAL